MSSTARSQEERAELDAILQSGCLNRAPNLSTFLRYVCERYFEGNADQIKEYNIAVEALGRPPEFDQKKDSIVRVEAHRLRKRLAAYYAGPGSGHTIKLVIVNGQYAPQFLHSEPEVNIAPATAPLFVPAHAREYWNTRTILVTCVFALLGALATPAIIGAIHRARFNASQNSMEPEVWRGNSHEPVSTEFRLLAGYHGPAHTDRQGHKWNSDSYFTGGISTLIAPGKLIEGSPDPNLLHSAREGDFRYDIPLRAGTYELHLYFSETAFSSANPSEEEDVRSFRVNVNGQTQLDLFDALSEAGGPNRLQVRVFKDVTPAKDGLLHLQFLGQSGRPFLNALEILPTIPGRIRPIRIVARKTPVTDMEGRFWSADEFVMGGHLTERSKSISNSAEKDLFEGERFGIFSYHIPVAPGKYRVTLRFAETYFGSTVQNAPPFEKASRLFDVRANGMTLLKDFDIGVEAGGPNRGIEKRFEDIEPNAQGLIVLEFHPTRNYACVNAIEIEETS